jgi:hypothetical protein
MIGRMRQRPKHTAVYLEIADRKAFACAVDWPGWARSGKNEDLALEAFAAYAPRYAVVAKEAGVTFPARAGEALDVVERVPGNATTSFGAPGIVPQVDREPLNARQATRMAALVEASWAVFDRVAGTAPASLRKGPRGGGRDRDKIISHVLEAEDAYARKMGIKLPAGERRAAILEALRAARSGEPPTERGWPPRYAAFRIAWHVLDHAWGIEDRS